MRSRGLPAAKAAGTNVQSPPCAGLGSGICWAGAWVVCVWFVCSATGATAAERVPQVALQAISGIADDAPPEVLRNVDQKSVGEHYLWSNERNLHLFEPTVRDRRGVLIGVGTDQMYTLAGWQDPDLLLLTDYDPWVKHIHRAYFALLAPSATPKAFIARWSPAQRKDSTELLRTAGADASGLRLFAQAGGRIHWQFVRIQAEMRKAKVACWLTDQTQYDRVRALVVEGRAKALQADWTKSGAMPALLEALRKHGLVVQIAYLSNAEDYLQPYPPVFRQIVRAIPASDDSWWLRTQATGRSSIDLRYNIQRIKHFANWLGHPQVRSNRQIAARPPGATYDTVQFTETKVAEPPAWLLKLPAPKGKGRTTPAAPAR